MLLIWNQVLLSHLADRELVLLQGGSALQEAHHADWYTTAE